MKQDNYRSRDQRLALLLDRFALQALSLVGPSQSRVHYIGHSYYIIVLSLAFVNFADSSRFLDYLRTSFNRNQTASDTSDV